MGTTQLPTAPASTDDKAWAAIPPWIEVRDVIQRLTQLPAKPVSMPWKFARIDASGRRLTLVYFKGDVGGWCWRPRGVMVQETPQSVLITVVSDRLHDGPCPLAAQIGYGYVDLAAPLGTRALLHPPADPEFAPKLLDWP